MSIIFNQSLKLIGFVLYYALQFMAEGTKSYDATFRETKNFMADADSRTLELTGLTPGTMYEITAYAENGAGMGETTTAMGTTLNGTANFP